MKRLEVSSVTNVLEQAESDSEEYKKKCKKRSSHMEGVLWTSEKHYTFR